MKTKTSEKLTPPTGDGTIPNHTIESNLTGKVEIDQGAIDKASDTAPAPAPVNPDTYKVIFEKGMASGAFDKCLNPAQVNLAIAKIKNNGKQCVYMVSEVAHLWHRPVDKWIKKENPGVYVPSVRGERKAVETGPQYLTHDEIELLTLQLTAFQTMLDNPKIKTLHDEIVTRLAKDKAARMEEATRREAVAKRTATLEAVKTALYEADKGAMATLTLTINMSTGAVEVVAPVEEVAQ
jgi:hypothetical protein